MSHKAYSGHLAITSGDKVTTRSERVLHESPRGSIDPSHAARFQ
jgi:hypothetical protein